VKSGLVIDPRRVEHAFRDCLYKDVEITTLSKGGVPEGAVIVEGIRGKYGFHPDRLEQQRTEVSTWLHALPREFHETGGGGWSFLNACNQANGVQWTGLHQRMEELFCLAIGLGLAECQLPREVWSALPGGVPYYVVKELTAERFVTVEGEPIP